MDIKTYTFDVEAFKQCKLNCHWSVETSAGLRYNHFREDLNDNETPQGQHRTNSFDGVGGIFGMELQRTLGGWGSLYGRARFAVMFGDKERNNIASGVQHPDATLTVWELAAGYEISHQFCGGSILFGRIGWEWQNWFNYTSEFNSALGTNSEDNWAGNGDVNFGGLACSVGFTY